MRRRSITFLEWVVAQNAIAADAAATADLRLAARFERVEHDLTIRLVEGTVPPTSYWYQYWWLVTKYWDQ